MASIQGAIMKIFTRPILLILSLFYIPLCGSLGIYLCQEHINIDITALIAVLLILVFNMFLPFFMIYTWEMKDKLLTNQNGD